MRSFEKALIIGITAIVMSLQISASNLRTVVNLEGSWQFSLGDDKAWAKPQFDDSKWDKIMVPSSWESQGYIEYDGFAWYRKKFAFPKGTPKRDIFIQVNQIDDVDKIYINGQSVGHSGIFPPNFQTAYNTDRCYLIPSQLLNFYGENTVAIRVYDDGRDGGIINGSVRLVYNVAEEELTYKFDGEWKLTIKDKSEFSEPEYDDSGWKPVKVPQTWQSQGFWGYNGHAWYRYKFELDTIPDFTNHYLVLGKIDDYDEVYLNGKLLGNNWHSSIFGDNTFNDNSTYRILRGYKIPKKLIKKGVNVISIRVYDFGGVGGIYEGPIGIANEEAWNELRENNEHEMRENGNFNLFNLFQ